MLGLLAASMTASRAGAGPGAAIPPARCAWSFPSVPGGVHDVIGRVWAERIKPHFGTIVIDNRGGGGGLIAANDVAHASPTATACSGQHDHQRAAHAGLGQPAL